MATALLKDPTSLLFPANINIRMYVDINRNVNKMSESNIARIREAILFAARAHRGQFRLRGSCYITHPFGVAFILAVLGCGRDEQIAAWLHDTVEEGQATTEEIRRKFGRRVANLVSAMTKTANYKTDPDAYFGKIAKAGAMILKLADRAHNHRDVDSEVILNRPCWSLKCCASTLNVLRSVALEYRATLKPNGRIIRRFDWIFEVAMKAAQKLETKVEQRRGAGTWSFCGDSICTNAAILNNPGNTSQSTRSIRRMVPINDNGGPAFTLVPSTHILFTSVDPNGQWSLPL